MEWERDNFGAHRGAVGVLLADGSEPGPVRFDTGSGGSLQESTDWWIYDGTFGAPRAGRIRARCSCGWRADASYPVDWDQVVRRQPFLYDTSAPEEDWQAHLDDVEARSVPLPVEITDLLAALQQQLERLADEAPLAALKAVGELDTLSASSGATAAYLAVRGDRIPWQMIAEGLGTTEAEARSRLHRYECRR
ncbi:hypothetical protein ABZ946_24285 [Streptomyces sp. NPDC046324]|uniref:hypothetical protein n=1 Tax=Streptomyces sp. NPDC046324 TaxID=3154915 RepID=UPI003404E593